MMTHTPGLSACFIKNVLYLHTHHLDDYIGFALNFLIPSFQIKGLTKPPPLCLPVMTCF